MNARAAVARGASRLGMDEVVISSIKIGERHRRDVGDISTLAKNIDEIGLLHPVVITPDNILIAGERRLSACKQLGWSKIPVTVVDLDDIVKGEFSENAMRKDFLPSEIYAICRAMMPAEEKAALERKREGGRKKGNLWKVSTSSGGGTTRDRIGNFAGVSGRTVEKIAKVTEAAERDPERFGDLPRQMDDTGKVDAAYAKVRRKERHTEIATKAAKIVQPDKIGPFPLIYADPPWKWGHFGDLDNENEAGKARTPDMHYETLTHEEIKGFRVGDQTVSEIASKDAALFLWCTSANMLSALEVMEAWGFEFKTQAVWVKFKGGKPQTGTGLVFLNSHEILLYGTRGKMPGPQHKPASAFLYPRGRHSAKPPEIRSQIEKMYPDFSSQHRAELFCRDKITGWSTFGHES